MRLMKLRIKNFRTIGEPGLEISLDDNNAIFLIGPNNAGKSTILHAYDYFVSASMKAGVDDFHRMTSDCTSERIDNPELGQHPHIKPAEIEGWLKIESDEDRQHQIVQNVKWVLDGDIVRVRKTWSRVGETAEKETFNRDTKE